MRSLLIVYSYHHQNTEKIAYVMGKVLDAPVQRPDEIHPEDLSGYDLIGFGSGIYHAQHHESLLSLVDRIPRVSGQKAFIFSTAALVGDTKTFRDHAALREKIQSKGYGILDEFSCKGFNTNSFLKFFGGMNKGRPDDGDLKRAQEFARSVQKKAESAENQGGKDEQF